MLTITERCWHTYRQEALIEKSPHLYCNHFVMFQWSNWCLCFGWFAVLLFAVAEWLCEIKSCDFGWWGCSPGKKSRISTQYILLDVNVFLVIFPPRDQHCGRSHSSLLQESAVWLIALEALRTSCLAKKAPTTWLRKLVNRSRVWMLRSALPKVHGSNNVHWMVVLNRLVRSRQPFRGSSLHPIDSPYYQNYGLLL